jgi:methionyl aminopeptidase
VIRVKSKAEIERLAEGGAILADILEELSRLVAPGIKTIELENHTRDLLTQRGVTSAFLNYAPGDHDPFPAALCVSVNDAVVHGIPGKKVLKAGDIVGLDLGIVYQGLYLDAARTVPVGVTDDASQTLLQVTREALMAGIAAARVDNTIGDIGAAIQQVVEGNGFSVVRQLVGHGVGYAVHEEPQVPNYGTPHRGLKLASGLVIAIEPMVTKGDAAVRTAEDGWTVEIASGERAAHEEHTIAVLPEGPRILTKSQPK